MTLAERALAAQQAGRLDEADACYRRLVAEGSQHPGVLNNLALVQVQMHRHGEAVTLFEQSLALRPGHPNTLVALANALTLANRPAEAIARCEEALRIDPASADACHDKAVALRALNRHREAIGELAALLARDPGDADAEYNLALSELVLGDFTPGWRHYEARWRGRRPQPPPPLAHIPAWKPGMALDGQCLLVQAEQGLGDTLQFVRFLAALDGVAELQVQEPLVAFLQHQHLRPRVGPLGEAHESPAPTLRIALMSLPLALGLETPAALCAPRAYLGATEPAPRQGGRRVGLAWRGRPTHQNDHNRSIPVELFAPWLEAQAAAGATVLALQKGVTEDERHFLARFDHVHVDEEALRDFDATACAVAALDEVLCVDTSVAHLAGALGCATTVLLPFAPDWRWGLAGEETTLYPRMRLARQPAIGAWTETIERLATT